MLYPSCELRITDAILKDKNECNYCRYCELICPDLAITVKPDKEEKKYVKKTLLTPVGGKLK